MTFTLPGLATRREDIEPNLDYEFDRFAQREGRRVTFNKEARAQYLAFATSPSSPWLGNFRDLAASVTRMATFAPAGRIDAETVRAEVIRLERLWSSSSGTNDGDGLNALLDPEVLATLDPFDRVQLVEVLSVCRTSRSMSEAGRTLFSASRARRTSANDADRLRKYLQRFGLDWSAAAQKS